MRKYLFFILLLCMHCIARGQTGYDYRYWFDNDYSHLQEGHSASDKWLFQADLNGLSESFHAIHIQVADENGILSAPLTRFFVKMRETEVKGVRYWFDNDATTQQTSTAGQGILDIDVSSLGEGYHKLYLQLDESVSSSPIAHSFVKIPQTEGVDYLTCLCSVDGKLFRQEHVPSKGGVINWNFDVSELSQGFHRMQVQVVTPSGAATSTYDAFFLRTTMAEEMNDMKCAYSIDGAEFYTEAGRMSNGAFHCDLDVSALTDGLHRLSYYLTNDKGVSTKISTQFFMKTPVGGNGIVQYEYWLNDSTEQVSKVKLAERTNPYRLISLLPVPKHPVSSKLFQFELTDGQPMIYAKNNIHIRFYDTTGRFTDESKQYVDYSVKQEVEPVGELQVIQTFDKVAENDIRWYTLQSAPGDTAAFRLSQPATIQLFAPSGKEVFKTSEAESVKWNGIHTWEEGTYYLAVHDVTGSKEVMTLDYMHMDKYDVVDWDVHRVGNGGFSTITFNGNGFYHLYSIELSNSLGDTIRSHEIEYLSDSRIRAWFNFFDAETGAYDAIFDFGDERKAVDNAITVEIAKDIDLATDVRYSNTYLRGRETTYTYEITNNGNMTAYGIPVYLYIVTVTRDGIKKINIEEIDKPDYTDIPGITDEERQGIINMRQMSGDDIYFYISENHDGQGNSETVRSNYFYIEIPPYSSKSVTVTLEATEPVTTYLNVSDGSLPLMTTENMRTQSSQNERQRSLRDQYCCIRDRLECSLNVLSDVSGFIGHFVPEGTPVSTITSAVSCASGVLSNLSQNAGYYLCRDYDGNDNLDVSVESYNRFMFGANLASSVIGCFAPDIRNPAQQIIEDARNLINDTRECMQTFNNSKGGCLPNQPKGGMSTPINSCEPNDMLGHVAESGSNAIKDGMTDVWYTIQFENDTVFATAPAHDIYLTDTLDVNLFDLSTYRPTKITIGEKSMELTGERNFISTLDMRPEINAIAQVEGTIDDKTGIVRWHISSLDPMSMEPSNDPMVGVLPVNYDGSGLGEASFDISLKRNLPNGTVIPNRSGNIFDSNETVLTPIWTNVIDRIAPESHITKVEQVNGGESAMVSIEANDELSGMWRYDVYVQYDAGAWFLAAENVPADTTAMVKLYEGINHHFYAIATDMAGNVEQKEAVSECSLYVEHITKKGDVNGDGSITAQDASLVQQLVAKKVTAATAGIVYEGADVNGDGAVTAQDASLIQQHVAKKIDLSTINP